MLTQNQIDIIVETMKPFDPVMIGVFGSFARDEETEESDIDIVFSFARDYSLFDLGGLFSDLKEALHRKVDVVPFKDMYPRVKIYALPDIKIIYEDRSNEEKEARMNAIETEISAAKSPGYKERIEQEEDRKDAEKIAALKKELENVKKKKGKRRKAFPM